MMDDDTKRILATARATKAQYEAEMAAGQFNQITARMYVARACKADPHLRAAIDLLIDEAIKTGAEFEDTAHRGHMGDHGKNGGRPARIDWTRVLEIDEEIDPSITMKTERAAIIIKRMGEINKRLRKKDAKELRIPHHTVLRGKLPDR